ncbi:MAG: hypothetical protein MUO43_05855 [Desulfobacterales bacterium]|nr:hypothetical protein [Desulfobacterales bacterium]
MRVTVGMIVGLGGSPTGPVLAGQTLRIMKFWNMPDPTDKIKSQIGKIQDSINKGQRQT